MILDETSGDKAPLRIYPKINTKTGIPAEYNYIKYKREYNAWRSMKNRCLNKKHPHYGSYGGRGIGVCADWLSFGGFIRDMGIAPPGHSIDRIDNDSGYSQKNCRWTTWAVQGSNRRRVKLYDFLGQKMTLMAISRRAHIPYSSLRYRIDRGWSVSAAVNTARRVYNHNKSPE
jgi:hypothetical protein